MDVLNVLESHSAPIAQPIEHLQGLRANEDRMTPILRSLAFLLLAFVGCATTPRAVDPWKERVIESATVRLHTWTIEGWGPEPLVLLSGGPGSAHGYMRELRRAAPEGMAVVAYDQRGTGLSTVPRETPYHVSDHVADLEAVRRGIGASRLHLLGHSWGGSLALAYAAEHPDHVASLILVGNLLPVAGVTEKTVHRMRAKIEAVLNGRDFPDGCKEQLRAILPAYFHDPKFKIPQALATCPFSCIMRDETSKDLQHLDLKAGLQKVTAPALVVFGEADLLGIETGRATVEALSGSKARLVALPRCGHFPWLECPDAFYAAVEPFLREARNQ